MSNNIKFSTEIWDYWFAGLIDGDGCFYINKQNEVSLEITTHVFDEKVLNNVKDTLKGGSVKLRSNSQSVRYRVKAKPIVYNVLQRVEGKILNSVRFEQYNRACMVLNYNPFSAHTNDLRSNQTNSKYWGIAEKTAYLAGLIDSDGTFTISVPKTSSEASIHPGVEGKIQRLLTSRGSNQLTLKIVGINKEHIENIAQFVNLGVVYDIKPKPRMKSDKHQYHWYIRTQDDFNRLIFNLKQYCPLRSVKMHRIRLVSVYFKYKSLGYHLSEPSSLQFKQWEKFCRSWYKYSY